MDPSPRRGEGEAGVLEQRRHAPGDVEDVLVAFAKPFNVVVDDAWVDSNEIMK